MENVWRWKFNQSHLSLISWGNKQVNNNSNGSWDRMISQREGRYDARSYQVITCKWLRHIIIWNQWRKNLKAIKHWHKQMVLSCYYFFLEILRRWCVIEHWHVARILMSLTIPRFNILMFFFVGFTLDTIWLCILLSFYILYLEGSFNRDSI